MNAAPFYKNYTKLYFDAKERLNKGQLTFWCPFFIKKCPFLPIPNIALNFWNMPCTVIFGL